jgi:hypothetical protein
MSEFRWSATINRYQPYLRRRIKAGRGTGTGTLYIPWLKVRDVPSKGTSSIVLGIKDKRAHHLLSELEAIFFFMEERKPTTIDIREQWPILTIEETLQICARMGVVHKYRRGFPEPFTIDFLLTEKIEGCINYRAVTIKTEEDRVEKKTLRRLGVEKKWCEGYKLPYTIMSTDQYTKTVLSNLRFMRSWFRHRFIPKESEISMFVSIFNERYSENTNLKAIIDFTAKKLRLDKDYAIDMFRYSAWANHIQVSLLYPIKLNGPLFLVE